jgi:sugar lactone lactonase YvrE
VAVAKNGDIYWTDSSSDFTIQDGVYSFFANPSGRLIHYSRSGRKNTVLLDKLWFANGLALSPDEDFVVVSETHASRLQKCFLKGAQKGNCEIFVEGLPGMTDNVTINLFYLFITTFPYILPFSR